VVDIRSFRSVDDAAATAAEMLRQGEDLRAVWKHAIIQMFDDYTSVLRYEGVARAAAMWSAEPAPTGDRRVDAAFAALGEHVARRDGWPVPRWTREARREAEPWWFVTSLRGMHPRALVESPLSFRKRGVFITASALERV
jgi:hypothetical protein